MSLTASKGPVDAVPSASSTSSGSAPLPAWTVRVPAASRSHAQVPHVPETGVSSSWASVVAPSLPSSSVVAPSVPCPSVVAGDPTVCACATHGATLSESAVANKSAPMPFPARLYFMQSSLACDGMLRRLSIPPSTFRHKGDSTYGTAALTHTAIPALIVYIFGSGRWSGGSWRVCCPPTRRDQRGLRRPTGVGRLETASQSVPNTALPHQCAKPGKRLDFLCPLTSKQALGFEISGSEIAGV